MLFNFSHSSFTPPRRRLFQELPAPSPIRGLHTVPTTGQLFLTLGFGLAILCLRTATCELF
jgi:hypothetical protein